MKKEKNRLKLGSYLKSFDSIKTWLISGDKVPKTHYKSMAIMFGLLLIGIPTFIVFILAATKTAFHEHISSLSSLAGVSFITLTPGLYVLWVTICCWRRVEGYKWGMIPFFD